MAYYNNVMKAIKRNEIIEIWIWVNFMCNVQIRRDPVMMIMRD